jgi:hypothetical protein
LTPGTYLRVLCGRLTIARLPEVAYAGLTRSARRRPKERKTLNDLSASALSFLALKCEACRAFWSAADGFPPQRGILLLEMGYRDFVAQISEDGLERCAIALPNSDSPQLKELLLICAECRDPLIQTERLVAAFRTAARIGGGNAEL